MNIINRIKKFALEAITGFFLWTVCLTPYVLLIVHMTFEQYVSWLIMEAIIVPPIAIFVVNITNRIVKRFIR